MLSVHFSTSERTRTAKRDAQRILSASSLPISPQRLITIYLSHNVKELFFSFQRYKITIFLLALQILFVKFCFFKEIRTLTLYSKPTTSVVVCLPIPP